MFNVKDINDIMSGEVPLYRVYRQAHQSILDFISDHEVQFEKVIRLSEDCGMKDDDGNPIADRMNALFTLSDVPFALNKLWEHISQDACQLIYELMNMGGGNWLPDYYHRAVPVRAESYMKTVSGFAIKCNTCKSGVSLMFSPKLKTDKVHVVDHFHVYGIGNTCGLECNRYTLKHIQPDNGMMLWVIWLSMIIRERMLILLERGEDYYDDISRIPFNSVKLISRYGSAEVTASKPSVYQRLKERIECILIRRK